MSGSDLMAEDGSHVVALLIKHPDRMELRLARVAADGQFLAWLDGRHSLEFPLELAAVAAEITSEVHLEPGQPSGLDEQIAAMNAELERRQSHNPLDLE